MPRCYLSREKGNVHDDHSKFNNFSATDETLAYRARRIFHILCVCG